MEEKMTHNISILGDDRCCDWMHGCTKVAKKQLPDGAYYCDEHAAKVEQYELLETHIEKQPKRKKKA